jgi:hypothetical protein
MHINYLLSVFDKSVIEANYFMRFNKFTSSVFNHFDLFNTIHSNQDYITINNRNSRLLLRNSVSYQDLLTIL